MHLYKVYWSIIFLFLAVFSTATFSASDPSSFTAKAHASKPLTAVAPPPARPTSAIATAEDPQKLSSIGSEKAEVDWITRSIAIFGVVLATINFCFSVWKLVRDRRLSVEDDFWFRKIVSPATIEPMIKAIAGLLDKTPNPDAPAETVAKFAPEVTTEFAKLYASMHTLGLYEPSLPNLVNDKLRTCEDILTEYVGALANSTDQQKPPSPLELRNQCFIQLNAALAVIKKRHLKR